MVADIGHGHIGSQRGEEWESNRSMLDRFLCFLLQALRLSSQLELKNNECKMLLAQLQGYMKQDAVESPAKAQILQQTSSSSLSSPRDGLDRLVLLERDEKISRLTQDIAERDAQLEMLARENQRSVEVLNTVRRELISFAVFQPTHSRLETDTLETMETSTIVSKAKANFQSVVRQFEDLVRGDTTVVQRVAKLEQAARDTGEENEQLRSQIAQLKNALQLAQGDLSNAEEELSSLRTQKASAVHEAAQVKEMMQDLRVELRAENEKVRAGEDRLQQMQYRLAEVEVQHEYWTTAVSTHEHREVVTHTDVHPEVSHLQFQLEETERERQSLKEEIDRLKATIADCQNLASDKLGKVDGLNLHLFKVKDELQGERDSSARLQEEVRMLRARLEEEQQHSRIAGQQEAQLKGKNTEIVRLEQQVAQLQMAVREKDVSVSSLEAQVEGLRNLLRERESVIQRVQSDVAHEFENVTGTLQSKVHEMQQLQEQLLQSQATCTTLKEENLRLVGEAAERDLQFQELAMSNNQVENALRDKERGESELQSKLRMLDVALQEKTNELRVSEESLRSREQELHRISGTLAESGSEAQHWKQMLASEEKNGRWLQEQVDSLSRRLAAEEEKSREAARLTVLVETRHEETVRLSSQITTLTSSLREADVKRVEQEGAFAALAQQNTDLKGQVQKLEEALAAQRQSFSEDQKHKSVESEKLMTAVSGAVPHPMVCKEEFGFWCYAWIGERAASRGAN